MIYTLYSFKGGVGRSMALANVAAYFCRRGLRVLMIDWDLEAPGLESYFYPADSKPAELAHASARPGLIDLLVDYKKQHPALALLDPTAGRGTEGPITADAIRNAEELAPIAGEFRQKRKIAEGRDAAPPRDSRARIGFGSVLDRAYPTLDAYLQLLPSSSPGELWLLGAGARARETFAAYAEAVQHFDWREFIASYDGKDYLEWLRGRLASFDVVLIDSRTGVTEVGGICTRQMADAVVAFCAPNNQNVDGVDRIVQSLDTSAAKTARFNRTLDVLVIPTRVDDSEAGLLGEFSEVFRTRFEHDNRLPEGLRGLDRPFWNLQIPYTSKYNFRERLVIEPAGSPDGSPVRLDRPTAKLVEAYENVALHLAVLAPPEDRVRKALQSEIASAFPRLLPHGAPAMVPALPDTWIERPAVAAELKEALLRCAHMPDGGRLALWGPAGTGKTTLLARLCADQEIAAAYPDGIVWLTLEGAWGPARLQDFLRAAFAVPRAGGRDALQLALARRKFLFVVDDVWTADQLDALFEFGQQHTRAIVTRDLATAAAFADTVVTVGTFTADESAQLVRLPPESLADLRTDVALSRLIAWPLGASLVRAALDRQPTQVTSPARALADLRSQLQESGLRVLEQPQTPGRNRSVDASLRDTITRLSPEARRHLLKLAAAGDEGLQVEPDDIAPAHAPRLTPDEHATRGVYRAPARVLLDMGVAVLDGDRLLPDPIVSRWVADHRESIGGPEEERRRQRNETVKRGFEIVRGASATLAELERIASAAKDARAFSL